MGKKFLYNKALEAEVFVVFAKTDMEKTENNYISIYNRKRNKGFSIGEPEGKNGSRGSSTCESLFLKIVLFLKRYCWGKKGEGFKIALSTLNGGRIGVAAQAIGLAQGALDEAIKYVKEREVNGKKVSQFQNTPFFIS